MLAGLLIYSGLNSAAHAQDFIWAKTLAKGCGGGSNDGHSIAVDALGNVYTTGYFFGTADFDPGAGTFNLTSVDGEC